MSLQQWWIEWYCCKWKKNWGAKRKLLSCFKFTALVKQPSSLRVWDACNYWTGLVNWTTGLRVLFFLSIRIHGMDKTSLVQLGIVTFLMHNKVDWACHTSQLYQLKLMAISTKHMDWNIKNCGSHTSIISIILQLGDKSILKVCYFTGIKTYIFHCILY